MTYDERPRLENYLATTSGKDKEPEQRNYVRAADHAVLEHVEKRISEGYVPVLTPLGGIAGRFSMSFELKELCRTASGSVSIRGRVYPRYERKR